MDTSEIPFRRCDNCGKRYQPKQRRKKNDKYGFCKHECKTEFHNNGGQAFTKLKPIIEKQIRERIKKLSPADAYRMDEIEKRLAAIEEFIRIVKGATAAA